MKYKVRHERRANKTGNERYSVALARTKLADALIDERIERLCRLEQHHTLADRAVGA